MFSVGDIPRPALVECLRRGYDNRTLGRFLDSLYTLRDSSRVLGLPFPGGPHVDREAKAGDPAYVEFPRGLTGPRDLREHRYDFSFSGLKTAVRLAAVRASEGLPPRERLAAFGLGHGDGRSREGGRRHGRRRARLALVGGVRQHYG